MFKNRTALLTGFNTILISIFFIYFLATRDTAPTVFVDKVQLFEKFHMTQEMKRKGEKEFSRRKDEIEQMYASLPTLVDSKEKMRVLDNIAIAKEELQKFSDAFSRTESDKIWLRINTYIKTFSKEHSYKLIIGTEGNRGVLYGDPGQDITNVLITYVNKKYEGGE